MNVHSFKLGLLAVALGGAAGIASAQQAGTAAPSPAAVKAAVDVQGNKALSTETAVAGTPIQGSPGTQSGVAVTDTRSMGASAAWGAYPSHQAFAELSRTQLLALQRHEALR